ncbi:MAG: hypothetical protein ACRD8U_11195 [Pyrinomonadaceae bacterium]
MPRPAFRQGGGTAAGKLLDLRPEAIVAEGPAFVQRVANGLKIGLR